MTTNDTDARERAWQEWEATHVRAWIARAAFEDGWDAAKREDEQRIAALVAAAQEAVNYAEATWSYGNDLIHPCLVCTGETSHIVGCWVENLGRALAGSEEASSVDS